MVFFHVPHWPESPDDRVDLAPRLGNNWTYLLSRLATRSIISGYRSRAPVSIESTPGLFEASKHMHIVSIIYPLVSAIFRRRANGKN